jgi:hypothetical protein
VSGSRSIPAGCGCGTLALWGGLEGGGVDPCGRSSQQLHVFADHFQLRPFLASLLVFSGIQLKPAFDAASGVSSGGYRTSRVSHQVSNQECFTSSEGISFMVIVGLREFYSPKEARGTLGTDLCAFIFLVISRCKNRVSKLPEPVSNCFRENRLGEISRERPFCSEGG